MRFRLPSGGGRSVACGLAIAGFALLLRFAYLGEMRGEARFETPIVDAYYHDQWARSIAAGDWRGQEAFFRAPLYPYALAVLYRAAGPSHTLVRVVQFMLGALTAVMLYRLGTKLYGMVAGVAAGFLYAAYWVAIYHEGELLLESSLVFLQVAMLSALVEAFRRPAGWRFAAAGLLAGLSAIERPNILLFAPAAAAWFILSWRRSRSRAELTRWALAGLAGLLLPIAPVTLHNYAVSRDLVLVSWQGGSSYYTGNNPIADGVSARAPGVRTYWWEGYEDVVLQAERAAGRPLRPSEVSDYWFGRALAFAREEPGRFLALQARKFGIFWFAQEKGDESDINVKRGESLLLRLLPVGFGLVAPLGLVGLALSWRRAPEGRLLLLYLVCWTASVTAFFVTSRFRLPVAPPLMLWAGVTIAALWQAFRSGETRRWAVPLAAAAALMVLVRVDFYGVGGENVAQERFNNGLVLNRAGRLEEAAAEYREAVRLAPNYLDAQNNLGTVYLQQGRLEEALAAFEQAVRVNSEFAMGHYNLGVVQERLGRLLPARASYELAVGLDPEFVNAWFALGSLHQKEGRPPQAAAAYARGLQGFERIERITPIASREDRASLYPAAVRAYLFLGQEHLLRNEPPEAAEMFRRALAVDAFSAGAHHGLGLALFAEGRDEEAEEQLREAIGLDPQAVDARYVLALRYADRSDLRQAASQLEEVLRIEPDHRNALFNLGVVRARQHLFEQAIELWTRVLALNPADEAAQANIRQARAAMAR